MTSPRPAPLLEAGVLAVASAATVGVAVYSVVRFVLDRLQGR